MNLQSLTNSMANPEVPINENFEALDHLSVYAKNPATTTGLTWGYLGGRWGGFAITAGTVTLTANSTNYVVVARATGVISTSTTSTNWDNTDDYARVYKLTTDGSTVTTGEDHRAGDGGIIGGIIGGGAAGGSGGPAPLITESTTSRDVTPADAGSYIRFTSDGAKTAVFDSADGFSAPEEYQIANRASSGDLTLSGSGVTLNPPKNGSLVLEPGDTVMVKFFSATIADVFGTTAAAIIGDPYISDVTLLLHMDGANLSTTFADSSSLGVTVTRRNTNSYISTTQSKFGGASCAFSTASSSGLDIGTWTNISVGDFTIEFWVYPDGAQTDGRGVLFCNTNGGIRCFFSSGAIVFNGISAGSNVQVGTTGSITTNAWSHVALTRVGTTFRTFLNGIKVDEQTNAVTFGANVAAYQIGYSPFSGTSMVGWMDDFRVTAGTARYTADFAVPTEAFPDS